eukprot:TRINITY_DN65737_c2_g1_i2.p1 TRINITY_DN65737_c2_g1~~TRINITY_DN65737_c2_g1_i2.p1  ORF type:complete len:635 (+),score=348.68 TRINITY_DN65737_c2_g1_i2:23-1906(+)
MNATTTAAAAPSSSPSSPSPSSSRSSRSSARRRQPRRGSGRSSARLRRLNRQLSSRRKMRVGQRQDEDGGDDDDGDGDPVDNNSSSGGKNDNGNPRDHAGALGNDDDDDQDHDVPANWNLEDATPRTRSLVDQLRKGANSYQIALEQTRERMAAIVQQFQTTLEQQTVHTEQLELSLAETVELLQSREEELNANRDARSQLAEARQRAADDEVAWQQQRTELEGRIREGEVQIAALQDRLAEVTHGREEMEVRYMQANDRMALLEAGKDEAVDKANSLDAQVRQLRIQLRDSEKERTSLTQELSKERVRFEKQSGMLLSKVVTLEQQLDKGKEQRDSETKSINERIAAVNAQVKQANQRNKTIEHEAKQLRAEREELHKANLKLKREVYILRSKQNMHEHTTKKYEENVVTLQTQIRVLLDELRRLKAEQKEQIQKMYAAQRRSDAQKAVHELVEGNTSFLPPLSSSKVGKVNGDKATAAAVVTGSNALNRVQFKLNMISESLDAFFPGQEDGGAPDSSSAAAAAARAAGGAQRTMSAAAADQHQHQQRQQQRSSSKYRRYTPSQQHSARQPLHNRSSSSNSLLDKPSQYGAPNSQRSTLHKRLQGQGQDRGRIPRSRTLTSQLTSS